MEDSIFQDTSVGQPFKKTSKRGKRAVLIVVVFLVLLGAGAFLSKTFIGGVSENTKNKITPTPTEFIFPTDTPMPTETQEETTPTKEPKKTPTPTPKPTSNPIDKTTGLDRSELSVEVRNGGGVKGAASKMADVLKGFGYNVLSTGNADNFDYENTVIEVKSEKNKYLQLLKSDLSASYTIGTTSSSLSASSSADAVVIVGK